MSKMKQYTAREAKRVLRNNGFKEDGCKGSHFHFVRDGKTVVVNKDLNTMVWHRIVKENKLVL